jgi:hypothetical protein
VDDFGVKYVGKEHADHLVASLKTKYKLVEDWTRDIYCGIKLHWDYDARTLDISMPGYVRRQLLKYKHVTSSRPQHCPYSPEPKKYGSEAQAPLPIDTSRPLDKKEIKNCGQHPLLRTSSQHDSTNVTKYDRKRANEGH